MTSIHAAGSRPGASSGIDVRTTLAHAAHLRTGPVAVVGAGGKTGRRVAARLTDAGLAVRPLSRSTAVPFDWERPATWASATAGTSAAYVAYAPDLAFPGAAETVAAFVDHLGRTGVRRVVLLSGRGEDGARAAEQALLDTLASASVVRSAFFTQNFTEGDFLPGVLGGEVALPAPADVPEPFVDLDDLADVAVTALADDRYAGEVLEVTGPQALTFPEAVAQVARGFGRIAAFREVPGDEFVAALVAAGAPAELGYGLVELFGEVLDGRNVATTATVEQVLGRAPRTVADTARLAAGRPE